MTAVFGGVCSGDNELFHLGVSTGQSPRMLLRNRSPGQLTPVRERKHPVPSCFLQQGSQESACVSIFVIHFKIFPVLLKWEDLLQSPANRGKNWSRVSRQRWVGRALGSPESQNQKKLSTDLCGKAPMDVHLPRAGLWKKTASASLGWLLQGGPLGSRPGRGTPSVQLVSQLNRLPCFPSRLVC